VKNVSPGYTATLRVVDGQGYTRDVAQGKWLQAEGAADTSVTITGLNGAALPAGTIVTGEANLRAVSVQNDRVKYTYENSTNSNYGSGHMYIMFDGEWRRCFSPTYGDYAFFAVPIPSTADRIVVLRNDGDVAEISIEWTALALNTSYLSNNGIVERNYTLALNYNQSSSVIKYLTTTHLRKLVRVERGKQGYYIGYHSSPLIGPDPYQLHAIGASSNNETAFGEREVGTGGGTAVAFASTGKKAYFPAWRTQRNWAAVLSAIPTFDNYAFWPGLDDPTYSPWNNAAVIAMQPAGYPAEQASGPWWIADIPADDYGGYAHVCRYIVQRNPNELGVWNYASSSAFVVNHFTNPWREADGRPTKYPLFVGAEYYVPDASAVAVTGYTGTVPFGAEPSAALQSTIAAKAAALTAEWPQ